MKLSAGLVLLKHGKILLVHPTGSAWKSTQGIPKGQLDGKEDALTAALREVQEEIGLIVPLNLINTKEHFVDYKNTKGDIYKRIFYYIADVTSLELDDVLSKSRLQLKEVDYAKFYTKKEAEALIIPKQLPILSSLR